MISTEKKFETALATGNNLKPEFGLGKEFYAIWDHTGNDMFLEFIYTKVKAFYPKLAESYSVVGVFWELYRIQPSMFRHDADSSMYFIHKRKFKRHLKKAIVRSRLRS